MTPQTNTPAASNNARSFSPIFTATVTPAAVEMRSDKKGNNYAFMKAATIEQVGKSTKVRTVMAFGKPFAEVGASLVEGQPIELAVAFDGGSLRIVGFPKAKQENAAANG